MEFLTTEEYAKLMGVHKVTVQAHCRDGKIPAVRVGSQWRIPSDCLQPEEEPPEEPKPPEGITEDQEQVIAQSIINLLRANVPIAIQVGR